MIKILKWFWLLFKAVFLHKTYLKISFTKESNGRWYVDFPSWPLSHDNLEMVAGADDMLDLLNDGSNHIHLLISEIPMNNCVELTKVYSALTKGAFYTAKGIEGWGNPNAIRYKQLWLCPVTLTIIGHYPNKIYFVKEEL